MDLLKQLKAAEDGLKLYEGMLVDEAKKQEKLRQDNRRLVKSNKALEAENKRLKEVLEESVKLQSHYAELLNMHDGGERIIFNNSKEWVKRLDFIDKRKVKACKTCNDTGKIVRTFTGGIGLETPWRPKGSLKCREDETKDCPKCK